MSIARITALREERHAAASRMKRLVDDADRQGRNLSRNEAEEFDGLEAKVERLDCEIGDAEKRSPQPRLTRGHIIDPVAAREVRPAAADGAVRDFGGFAELRALLEGSGSGQYVVPEELAPRVWDRLAAASVVLAAGATVLTTSTDTLRLPRLTADAAAAWVSEGATLSEGLPTISEVVAYPRKVAGYATLSRELVDDATPDVLSLLMQNLARSIALKIDAGFLEGSGAAPEVRGIKNTASIGTVSMGTNGASPTNLDPFADAIGTLEAANATPTALFCHPRVLQSLNKLKEVSGGTKPTMLDSAGSGADGPRRSVFGIPVFATSALSITETQGTSTDCASAYLVQADQLVAVRRQDVIVEVDRSHLFDSDSIAVRATARWDLVVPNPSAIVRIVGIRP